jgi:hypothetical protein
MPSEWISHVKAYAAANGVSYKDALKGASASYVKKGRASPKGKMTKAACEAELAKVKQQLRDVTRPERRKRKALREIAKASHLPPYWKDSPDDFGPYDVEEYAKSKMPSTLYVQ